MSSDKKPLPEPILDNFYDAMNQHFEPQNGQHFAILTQMANISQMYELSDKPKLRHRIRYY